MTAKRVVLVEYFCTDDVTLVFGVRPEWDKPKVAEVKIPVMEIRRETSQFFGDDLDENRKVVRPASAKVQNLDEEAWQRIFNPMIAPIREWTEPGDIVWLVPHDALHYLPMHALKLDGQYLIERNPVVYSPSASVMKYCQLKHKGRREHALVLGDSLGDLPHAGDEARAVAAIFRTDAHLQSKATKQLVKEKLEAEQGDIDVLHFACHGYFDQFQPLKSGIKLAKNGEENPNLTAEEIFALGMHAELVVLSACESGVNDRKPGDELMGLTRSLIYAGTPSVIVTLWSVRDFSTRLLMQIFYEEWLKPHEAPITKAEALQRAQLSVMRMTVYDALAKIEEFERHLGQNGANNRADAGDSMKVVESPSAAADASRFFAQPYHWAPFILVGDWK